MSPYTHDSEPGAGSYSQDSEPSAGSYSNDGEPTIIDYITGNPIGLLLSLTYNVATSGSYTFDSEPS